MFSFFEGSFIFYCLEASAHAVGHAPGSRHLRLLWQLQECPTALAVRACSLAVCSSSVRAIRHFFRRMPCFMSCGVLELHGVLRVARFGCCGWACCLCRCGCCCCWLNVQCCGCFSSRRCSLRGGAWSGPRRNADHPVSGGENINNRHIVVYLHRFACSVPQLVWPLVANSSIKELDGIVLCTGLHESLFGNAISPYRTFYVHPS